MTNSAEKTKPTVEEIKQKMSDPQAQSIIDALRSIGYDSDKAPLEKTIKSNIDLDRQLLALNSKRNNKYHAGLQEAIDSVEKKLTDSQGKAATQKEVVDYRLEIWCAVVHAALMIVHEKPELLLPGQPAMAV